MKYFQLMLLCAFIGCSKQPPVAPATRQTVWIDEQAHADTTVTNVNDHPNQIYFAENNWQQSPDTNFSHGYRFIGILNADSILVTKENDFSSNYTGPFLLQLNKSKTL